MPSVKLESPQTHVRVNFSNRGLRKVVKSVRSLGPGTPNKAGVVEIASVLQDVVVDREEPVEFSSLPGFVGVDYVGYIIEKERLDKRTGSWLRIDEYRLVGSLSNNFNDSRVAHGNYYRYRIKSVIKVTYAVKKESSENFELVESVKDFQASAIKTAMQAQEAVIASVESVANVGLQSQVSTGQVTSAFQFLEGLKVEAAEAGTQISQDSAQAVAVSAASASTNLRSLKNLAVSDLSLMQGNATQSTLQSILQEEALNTRNVETSYVSRYYESEPTSKWVYVDVSETVLPPPPTAIKITPSTPEQSISIAWLTPSYPKGTITGFNLYRREMVGRPWHLMSSFVLGENLYVDQAVEFNREYIYAMTSMDVHGVESLLSTQIQAELNPNFVAERRERLLRWISGSGARPDQGFDNVFKKFFENEVPIVVQNNIVIGPTEIFKETDKKYLIRVKSLDTHEKKEFVVSLKNENIKSSNNE